MFQTEGDHKGLFTFYREQAELQQQLAVEQRHSKSKSQFSKAKHHLKDKHVPQLLDDIDEKDDRTYQSSVNSSQNLSPKKSFQFLNKAYVKQLSLKNQPSPEPKPKELSSQIVVILKGRRPSKQDLKLNRLNLKYQMHQGHFLKEKSFTPLEQVTTSTERMQQNHKNPEESLKIKRTIKKHLRMSDRYSHSKSQLQNQLILSREMKPVKQNRQSVKFQGVKKVNMFNELQQLPEIERGYTTSHQSTNHIAHKRIPPKALASILKSQNHEIIRQLRKAIEKEKEEERKNAIIQRHHSFIEYGSFDYDRKQLDLGKLNQKQRRMISILNKFSKRD